MGYAIIRLGCILDRFAYGSNNPSSVTDPSGHKPCWATAKYSCHLDQKTVDREYAKYSGQAQAAAAAFFASQGWSATKTSRASGIITPQALNYFMSVTSGINRGDIWWADTVSSASSSTGLLSAFDPDAILWGVGLSGSEPGIYNTAGMEEIVMFSNLQRATFSYGGQGGSIGVGASAAMYGGVVFNLKSPEAYKGPFAAAGGTASVLDVGLTVSYFWDDNKGPFTPGATQGFAIGYAPGAQASVWWSSTTYSMTWLSNP